jgi:1-phosphofructokinase family hexose kinase
MERLRLGAGLPLADLVSSAHNAKSAAFGRETGTLRADLTLQSTLIGPLSIDRHDMILCVTLNACLDKTLTVPTWTPGHSVRGSAVREVVGGKGNNVARALKRLGREARPVTFLGGDTGRRCEAILRAEDGLDPIAVATQAATRVILTVRTEGDETGVPTAFFDPDPVITEDESQALHRAMDEAIQAGGVEMVTLSGSSPSESTDSVYSDLIGLARRHGVPVCLDTYGRALEAIWGFWPDVMQLNRREASGALGRPVESVTDEDVLGVLADWARHGVRVGVVTDGPNAILAFVRGVYYRVLPAAVDQVVNPIGSGDSLLAGLADGWLAGLEAEALLRHAAACAGSNAGTWDAGAIDREAVAALEPTVRVERLEFVAPVRAAAGLHRHATTRRR